MLNLQLVKDFYNLQVAHYSILKALNRFNWLDGMQEEVEGARAINRSLTNKLAEYGRQIRNHYEDLLPEGLLEDLNGKVDHFNQFQFVQYATLYLYKFDIITKKQDLTFTIYKGLGELTCLNSKVSDEVKVILEKHGVAIDPDCKISKVKLK